MTDKKEQLNEKLNKVTGGKRNSDGTYSFTKGQRMYKDHMQYWFYEVLEDYTNVSGDTRINVDQYSTISDTNQGHATVKASDLQYCENYNGKVRL